MPSITSIASTTRTTRALSNVPLFPGLSATIPSSSADTSTPTPSLPAIFPRERDYLMILARQNTGKIYKSVDISAIRTVEELFNACGLVWGMEVDRLYVYLPGDSDSLLEIRSHFDFKETMRLFPRAPDNETVLIKVLLLAEGQKV